MFFEFARGVNLMISELLPRYCEEYKKDIVYTVIRSIIVEGHEVAWMEYTGHIAYDIMGQGREGQSFVGRALYCECDFIEGVGWRIKGGQRYSLDGGEKCLYRKAAVYLRHLELRREYLSRFQDEESWGDSFVLRQHINEIILDLVEKAKVGEFIEDGSGAAFWDGYFYLQTVADITDQFIGHIWEKVHQLVEEKKIGLEGAVIQPYREPPPPEWVEFSRIEDKGWVGIASLPGHRKMAREWRLEVLKPDGIPAYRHIPGLVLTHDPEFGPDVEDVARVEQKLRQLIKSAKKRK